MCTLVSFILFYLVIINVNAFDYDRSFLAEVKPKISELCYKDLVKADKSLRKFIIQAVSVWNAKTPGLLNGSHDYTGNYAECLDSNSSPVVMQYCVLDVGVTYDGETPISCKMRAPMGLMPCSPGESSSPAHILRWALCTAGSCSKSNVQKIAETLLQKSDIGRAGLPFKVSVPKNTCQTSVKIPFRTESIIFLLLVGAIATIVTICTVWHWCFLRAASGPKITAPVLVRNWSVIEHFSSLVTPVPSDIQPFHCIKFIIMVIMIIAHELLFFSAGPMANLGSVFSILSVLRLWRIDLAVDIFFAMSGFILARNYTNVNSKSLIDLIISRYFRILPVFALVVFYASSLLEYSGSGPFWPIVANIERDSCQKNWWLSLLMINTFGDWSQQCWVVSWYLACEFYYFFMAILLFRLFRKNEKLGLTAICLSLIAATVYVGAYIAYNNEPVLIVNFNDSFRQIRDGPSKMYVQARFRASAYLIGMLGGYFTHALTKKKMTISQGTANIGFLLSGTILSLLFMSGVFYGSDYPYSVVKAALYGSLVRPAWSLGFILLTLILVFSKNTKVTAFTEMRIWAPLSRLTFSMYLVHMMVLLPRIGRQVDPFVFDVFGLLARGVVDCTLTVLLALAVCLCVEKPFYGLFTLAKHRIMKKPKLQ